MKFSALLSAVKYPKELLRRYCRHQWDVNDDGEILIGHVKIQGSYSTLAPDGQGEIITPNLITIEGANYLLGVALGAATQYSKFYIAPFSGNVSITDTLTAATFTSTTTEVTAYSEGTRVEFVESAPANRAVANTANPAVFTSSSDNLTIWGFGLLSTATKSATTGVLLSAMKYSTARTLPVTGDTLSVKYTLTLNNS